MQRLRDSLFRVRFKYTDPVDAQRARGLLTICNTLFAIGLLGIGVLLATFAPVISIYASLLTVVSFLIFAGITMALVQRGRLHSASWLLVISVLINTGLLVLPYGLNTLGVLVLTVPLLLAGSLFERRGLLLATFVLLILIGLIGFVTTTGILPVFPIVGTANRTSLTIILTGLFILTDLGILWAFGGAQNDLITRLSNAARDLRAATSISQAVNTNFTVDELLSEVAESVREQFGYYHVQVYLVESSSRLIVRRARTGSGALQNTRERRIAPDDGENVVSETVRAGRVVRVGATAPRTRRSEFLPATQSEVLLPLRRGEQILGVLDVHSIMNEAFSAHDIEVLEAVSAQLAIALQDLQRFTELQIVRAERQRLSDQVTRLNRDVERLTQEVAGRGWSSYLRSRSQEVLGFDLANGQIKPNSTLTPSLSHGLQNAMPDMRLEGDEQVLSVPIHSRGQTLGIMEFRVDGHDPWNPRSVELARLISQRLALALDNIRLFEQAEQTAQREQTINQVAARLQSKTELDGLLSVAADEFSRALGATRTRIQIALPESLDDHSPALVNEEG